MSETLIVALAGIAATLAAGYLAGRAAGQLERDRWQHEDRTRYHQARLTLYARFLEAAHQDQETYLNAVVRESADEALALGVMRQITSEIQIVSTMPVYLAATRLRLAVLEIQHVAIERTTGRPVDDAVVRGIDYDEAASAFLMEARKELGVTSELDHAVLPSKS